MKLLKLILPLCIPLMISACQEEVVPLNVDELGGCVQKGPYLNGTDITISELTGDIAPTGRNFSTQVLDNSGIFAITNLELESQFVMLKANGFYYNEVLDNNSSAQLTLFALTDLSDKENVNINVLTNIEKARVEHLVAKGRRFARAKEIARNEIFDIFEAGSTDPVSPELLDITGEGEENAKLLAISLILQGYLPVPDFSEFLADISDDISDDGDLDDETLGARLLQHAKSLKLEEIRANLESRIENEEMNAVVPDFESAVENFIAQTDFKTSAGIQYPVEGGYGPNILSRENLEFVPGRHSMCAILPAGSSLKVKIAGDNWFFSAFHPDTGWEYSELNDSENSRIFTSTETGEIDFEIIFEHFPAGYRSNNVSMEVYENQEQQISWTREFVVGPYDGSEQDW